MKRPTEEEQRAWIQERYDELTEGLDELDVIDGYEFYRKAVEDYNNMMADKAEQERDDAWYRGTLEGGE